MKDVAGFLITDAEPCPTSTSAETLSLVSTLAIEHGAALVDDLWNIWSVKRMQAKAEEMTREGLTPIATSY